MAYGKDVRDNVRRAYVLDNLSLEVAAAKCGVAYGTAARWKKEAADAKDDWDKLRTANLMASGTIEDLAREMLTGMVLMFNATTKEVYSADTPAAVKVQMLGSMGDAFHKMMAVSKRLMPETNELSVALMVIEQLSQFVRERFPQHAGAFSDILEPFGEHLTQSLS